MIYQFPYNMMNWLAMTLVAGIMSVAVGAVYWDVRTSLPQHQDNVNNRANFHYVMATLALWPVLLMAISEVWRDKPAVARDVADGLYSKGIYILTKVIGSCSALAYSILSFCLNLDRNVVWLCYLVGKERKNVERERTQTGGITAYSSPIDLLQFSGGGRNLPRLYPASVLHGGLPHRRAVLRLPGVYATLPLCRPRHRHRCRLRFRLPTRRRNDDRIHPDGGHVRFWLHSPHYGESYSFFFLLLLNIRHVTVNSLSQISAGGYER